MPLARFHKLDPDKQDRILEAAAEEFAANGFEGASINKIIAAAGISKGAVYYYFEDKADLFVTVVDIYTRRSGADLTVVLGSTDADDFWARMHDLLEEGWRFTCEHPFWIGLGRAFSQMPREMWAEGPIGAYVTTQLGLLQRTLAHGQTLGAIRDDMPVDALVQISMGLNDSFERWMFARWDSVDAAEHKRMFRIGLENFHRLFLPFPRDLFDAWHPLEEES